MNNKWQTSYLGKLANIIASNVDKKIYPEEKTIQLCNYMDAYSNNYINSKIKFSEGSANNNEIIRYSLLKDDVIITKDSETPEDIAVSSVVNEELVNVVCGYHLAILRPKKDLIDGNFLMNKLKLPSIQNQFYRKANGITRFGLTLGAIENIEIIYPCLEEQRKIAKILTTVDNLIEKTETLIAKYHSIKQGMMHDLFTRGVDANGQLRPPVDEAPELYKESELGWIPKGWEVAKLSEKSELITSGSRGWACYYSKTGAIFVRIGNLTREHINFRWNDIQRVKPPICSEGQRTTLHSGDILISITADLGIIAVVPHDMGEAYINQHIALIRLQNKDINTKWVGRFLANKRGQLQFEKYNDMGTKAGLNLPTIGSLLFLKPSLQEQFISTEILDTYEKKIETEKKYLKKYKDIKKALMQDLLTGKVRVTPDKPKDTPS